MTAETTALRQAMKILGYTNQSLADELSDQRSDGQRTSPATVSRWVSGAQAVEPALSLYFRERLAGKLFEDFKPRLPSPKIVGIGGAKGGCGSSTIAQALAVVASNLKYRVAMCTYSPACNNGYFRDFPSCGFAMPEPGQEIDTADFDFVFVDLQSRIFSTPDVGPKEMSKMLSGYDLLVVPVDIGCGMAAQNGIKAFQFLESLPECPPWTILHTAASFCHSILFETLPMFKPWANLLLSETLYYRYTGDPLEYSAWNSKWKFREDSSECAFQSLLEEICGRLDVSLYQRPDSLEQARMLTLEELVERLTS